MNKTITRKDKLAYGLGAFGDTIAYNLITVYLLFFLTDIAHISTVKSGLIIFISSIVSSITIIICGYLSDYSKKNTGKRSGIMGIAIPLIFISCVCLFRVYDFNQTTKFFYYCIFTIILWLSHTLFVVPYNASAADITPDNIERTSLRSYARFYMSIANLIGLVLFTKLLSSFNEIGLTIKNTWTVSVLIISIFTSLSLFIAYRFIRRKEFTIQHNVNPKKIHRINLKNMVNNYVSSIKIYEMRYILLMVFLFSGGNTFFNSVLLYYMQYNLGIPEQSKSIVFLVLSLTGMILTPVLSKAACKKGNKWTMILCFSISSAGMISMYFFEYKNLVTLCVIMFFFTIAASSYWQFINTFTYEVGDHCNKNTDANDGTLTSLITVSLRLFSAVFSQLLTLFLQFSGYTPGALTQTSQALRGIEYAFFIVPFFFFIFVAFVVSRYKKYTDA